MEIITKASDLLDIKCEMLKVFNLNTVSFMNQLANKMKQTVSDGLSAPQIGINMRAFTMTCSSGQLLKVLNPKITERGKIVNSHGEHCLSMPNKKLVKRRPKRIKVEFRNEIGEFIKMELRNFDAFVFQHEMDHINGVL